MSASPVDLNGTWLDNGRRVLITHQGSSVVARYTEDYLCEYEPGVPPATTRDNFTATLSDKDRLLVGETTSCHFGTRSNPGRGIVLTPMKLRVNAEGDRLEGKVCLEGRPRPMVLTSLYHRVSLKLRTFIPSPAVSILPDGFMPPHFSIFGGDTRGFAYSGGTHRSQQSALVTVDPSVDVPGPIYGAFGATKQYSNVQGTQDSHVAWWWNIEAGQEPLFTNEVVATPEKGLVSVKRLDSDAIQVSFRLEVKLEALEPLRSLAWSITARISVHIREQEMTWPEYRVEGQHDGFPAYELYVNAERVYEYDPLVADKGPLSLFSGRSGDIRIPEAHGKWKPVPTKPVVQSEEVSELELDCPPWEPAK